MSSFLGIYCSPKNLRLALGACCCLGSCLGFELLRVQVALGALNNWLSGVRIFQLKSCLECFGCDSLICGAFKLTS